jgi:hypothetical protein
VDLLLILAVVIGLASIGRGKSIQFKARMSARGRAYLLTRRSRKSPA